MDRNLVAMGVRVEDLAEPYVPSEVRVCLSCKKDIWIQTEVIKNLQPKDFICINCAGNIVCSSPLGVGG